MPLIPVEGPQGLRDRSGSRLVDGSFITLEGSTDEA